RGLPQVSDAVVVAREVRPGDKRLEAYLVAEGTGVATAEELRQSLRAKLPDYMVPATFVVLDALPLTANGKVDRRALPEPTEADRQGSTEFVSPRTAAEEGLAEIWKQVLGITKVGVHDDFFALGGHSLLAVRMVDAANERLGVSLQVADVFRKPTAAQLASLRRSAGLPGSTGRYLEVVQEGSGQRVLVTLGTTLKSVVEHLSADTPIIWLKEDGRHVGPDLSYDIPKLVDIFIGELIEAVPRKPIVLFGFSYGGLLAYALACRLRRYHGRRVEVVLLEPSLPEVTVAGKETGPFKKTRSHAAESLVGRMARHFRTLKNEESSTRLPYIRSRVCPFIWSQVTTRVIRLGFWFYRLDGWVAGLQIKLNRPVSLERRYKYRSPLIKSNIRNFSAEQMPGDVLLVGRCEYLEETGSGWRHLVDGQCIMLELFESRNHGNVLTNEADTKIWLEVLQQLIEGSEVMLHRDR
ncbi:MAG: alpha/beta fold hydrolase, partial [Verrucomicrobiales bacterium]|nr:alpha/beta fold hydrolase [Verrucomicrobiales bacterium]